MSNNGNVVYKRGDVVKLLANFYGIEDFIYNGTKVFVYDDLITHVSFYYRGNKYTIDKKYISPASSYVRKEWKYGIQNR